MRDIEMMVLFWSLYFQYLELHLDINDSLFINKVKLLT